MWQLRDEVRRTVNPPRGALHNWGGEIQVGSAELAPSSQTRRRRIGARFRRTRKVRKKRVRWRDCEATEERHNISGMQLSAITRGISMEALPGTAASSSLWRKDGENYSKFQVSSESLADMCVTLLLANRCVWAALLGFIKPNHPRNSLIQRENVQRQKVRRKVGGKRGQAEKRAIRGAHSS